MTHQTMWGLIFILGVLICTGGLGFSKGVADSNNPNATPRWEWVGIGVSCVGLFLGFFALAMLIT